MSSQVDAVEEHGEFLLRKIEEENEAAFRRECARLAARTPEQVRAEARAERAAELKRVDAEILEHRGRFVIAKWDSRAAQYSGPLNRDALAGGCHSWFCRSQLGIPMYWAVHFASRAAARRWVRSR